MKTLIINTANLCWRGERYQIGDRISVTEEEAAQLLGLAGGHRPSEKAFILAPPDEPMS
jgi:hypothetical protein